ncbi:MAG: AAA family ATPase, partial [Pseudomonadota bacterium]
MMRAARRWALRPRPGNQKQTAQAIQAVQKKAEDLFDQIRRQTYDQVDAFVQTLADLRTLRGEVISLQDLPYTQPELIEALDEQAKTSGESLANDCISFLLRDDALLPYQKRITAAAEQIETIETAVAAKDLTTDFNAIGAELELLIEIVSNLPIDDATQTTRIIEQISGLFTHLNQHKASIKQRLQQLQGSEAAAEFGVQIKLLDQSMINYLDLADTPEKCDTYLTRLMVQLEELEGKFAEIDEFVGQLAEKREEVFAALEQRKNSLVEARNNRTTALASAAERILNGIQQRSLRFKDAVEINGFFASDLLISKVRDIIDNLKELDDSNKANSIQTQLKT